MTAATNLAIQIAGASFYSTHHASAADVLAGRSRVATPPAYALLAGRARRFTSLVTQLHMEVCGALGAESIDPDARPIAVFATCHGEIQTAAALMADFRESALVSSARFALSVHNAPSGLYSVATGSSAPSTTVTGENAVAASWLEAALTALEGDQHVLLSIADEPVPAQFEGPPEQVGVAAAFLLAPQGSAGRAAELALVGSPAADGETTTLHTLARLADAWVRGDSATIQLGTVQPGTTLELRLLARGTAR